MRGRLRFRALEGLDPTIMKPITQTTYASDDGQIFPTELECLAHEKTIQEREEKTRYMAVTHSPDTTEGRCWYGLTYLRIYFEDSYCLDGLITDYCYRTFGRPIQFIQGVQPMTSWLLRTVDLQAWRQAVKGELHTSVGDYHYPAKTVTLIRGERDLGLVEEK